ncbi:MAG: hypothetical protein AAF430_08270 [Myxococcota bacterium]
MGAAKQGKRRTGSLALAIALVLGWLPLTATGVVVLNGQQPAQNTTSAGLNGEAAVVQDAGVFGGFLATAVGPRHFLAAKHIGGSVGQTITFDAGPNQGTYTTIGFVDDPASDLRLWRISGLFASWVPLYTGSSELNATMTVFGRGGGAGPNVFVSGQLRGFEWGGSGVWSWGRNRIERFVNDPQLGPLIAADFNASGGVANECHISGGDSSGPWLVFDTVDGAWELAGISSSVTGPFQQNVGGPSGIVFDAMLWEYGGLYIGEAGSEFLVPFNPFAPRPTSAFAVRVSDRAAWIAPQLVVDTDGDGLTDDVDNCTLISNPSQGDTDSDGFGNGCDCDFNQDNLCDSEDFGDNFLPAYQTGVDPGIGTDMNTDGAVSGEDFLLFLPGFETFGAPGPSAGTAWKP